jgi:S1-C subfamily serine protease
MFAVGLFVGQANSQEQPSSSGTGFFVTTDGWIVTNAHVVEDCARVKVVGRGEVSEWKLDGQNDLAILQSTGAPALPITVRANPPLRIGEDIAALGYPLASVLSSSIKITTGNINSLLGLADDTRYLQISTPVQPGNSGGPVVDHSGRLIGVVTAALKASASGDLSTPPQNVNFAIRSSILELFLESRSIPFQRAEENSQALGTADLAEKVAPSVVQILCYSQKADQVQPAAAAVPKSIQLEPFRPFRQFNDKDVIGFDYGTLKNVSSQQCLNACRRDTRCVAATYNQSANYCFLKSGAAVTVFNRDAVGMISADLASDVYETTFAIASDRDQPGGDYLHISQSSFVGCFVACLKDDRCRAFSYVRRNNSCWLKERVGQTVKRSGIDLGVK